MCVCMLCVCVCLDGEGGWVFASPFLVIIVYNHVSDWFTVIAWFL